MSSRRHALVGAAAGVYGLAVLIVGLWPSHVDDDLPFRDLSWYPTLEFCANVALFIPFGVLAMVVSRRIRWHWTVIAGVVVSAAIEGLQEVARPGRTADVGDVVANSLGVALGALLVVGVRRWRRRHTTRS